MANERLKKKLCKLLLLALDDSEDQTKLLVDILWEFDIEQEDTVLNLLAELETKDDVLQRDKNTGLVKITNITGLQALAEQK